MRGNSVFIDGSPVYFFNPFNSVPSGISLKCVLFVVKGKQTNKNV